MKWLVSQGERKRLLFVRVPPPPPPTPSGKGSSTELGYNRFSANTIVAGKVSRGIVSVSVSMMNGGTVVDVDVTCMALLEGYFFIPKNKFVRER